MSSSLATGRLSFTTDAAADVEHGDIIFIAVGTPPDENGSADLKHVLAVARAIGRHMLGFKVVAGKSTVPVGTAELVAQTIGEQLQSRGFADTPVKRVLLGQPDYTVVSNPEFLKEGAAIGDFRRPDRIIVGVDETAAGARGLHLLRQLYTPFTIEHGRMLAMDVRSAELTKYAANAMLATRISFMNELANLAEEIGADIELVRRGIGSDSRIGHSFLLAGAGYGGSCFPKDISALRVAAEQYGQPLRILAAVEEVNNAQHSVLAKKIQLRFGEDLRGMTFAVWGLAFKPNTDDMREAPSRVLVADLVRRGARVRAYDPVAMTEAARVLALDLRGQFGEVAFTDTADRALEGADALVILTEWKEFRTPSLRMLAQVLRTKAVFDGRNLYDTDMMEKAGLSYYPIGRRQVTREPSSTGNDTGEELSVEG